MNTPADWKARAVPWFSAMAEYGVYLYAFFMFLDAGQSFREVGLYGALAGWLGIALLAREYRPRLTVLNLAMGAFLISVLLSCIFSLKPLYSFGALREDILPGVVLFVVVSAFFKERRLNRLAVLLTAAGLVMLLMGLHGFLLELPRTYTAKNGLLYVDKNKYAFFLGYVFPFFLLFLTLARGMAGRFVWGMAALWGFAAVVLSYSRGSLGNIVLAIIIWAGFFINRRNFRFAVIVAVALVLLGVFAIPFLPDNVKEKFARTAHDIRTMSLRTTYFWKPALESVQKRPALGWGYGSKVYRDPRPFEGTTSPHWELTGGLHSEFIRVLFHQGVLGLAAYLLLLATGFAVLLKTIRRNKGFVRALAVSLVAVLAGSFVINAMLKGTPFRMLGLILGMAGAVSALPPKEEGE